MLRQAVALRRCAACDRWDGSRLAGDDRASVLIASETERGQCVGGPWHGHERGARAACGRWQCWQALAAAVA